MNQGLALVTGCNGFVGGHLIDFLINRGYGVCGVDLQPGPRDARIGYRSVDIGDTSAFLAALADLDPSVVFHLAAVANPRMAKEDPMLCFQTSAMGALGLFEHCRKNPGLATVIVGSSEEYKRKPGEDITLSEEDELDSASIYGSSKIIMETMGRAYAAQFGANVHFTRSFNHTGPGQASIYVLSDFARQVALTKLGKGEKAITTGNIALERDFLDVRDVVRAYCLIAEKGAKGQAYNVSSGSAYKLSWCLGFMLDYAGLGGAPVNVDPARLREGEPGRLVGLNTKLRSDTGWTPEIDIRRSLGEVVDYWMEIESAR